MKTIIVWFRNDLRVSDHPALAAACQDADRVVPVFILNDKLLRGAHSSSNRNRFLLECLTDLRESLQQRGGELYIRDAAKAGRELAKLAAETDAEAVYYTIDYSPYARGRDRTVTETLAEKNIALQAFPGRLAIDTFQGLVTRGGTTFKVFTPFWKKWEQIDRRPLADPPASIVVPAGLETGRLPSLADITRPADLSPEPIARGGETAGQRRLHEFLDDGIAGYTDSHNNLSLNTSLLSPYLHLGCISVRQIEELLPDGKGAASFHRQLAWRDFYHYILFHFPDNATQEYQQRYRNFDWDDGTSASGMKLLQAWQSGQTGYPVVDAAMRQLLQTGWMHNRARLIVGSFLTKDLGLDWRLGEKHFMQMLIDGDEANNNGNWQWIASVGVDPAPAFRRLYNPASQQAKLDPDGVYVRRYVPELAKLSDKYLAEPWKMPEDEQAAVGCRIGIDYPAPIVDHAEARRAALERYRR